MLFNSIDFLIFFPIVVAIYFGLPHRYRWILLLTASYYFYACWKLEYLALIIISTVVDYGAALMIAAADSKTVRKMYLGLSLLVNLGFLVTFKYFSFISESIESVFSQFDASIAIPEIDLLLPVGISFYTFQTLSYTIDVYTGKRKPERHLGIFALYVSFFPQLVAGPIERSTSLIPQFRQVHEFNLARISSGMRMIMWGFVKKVVIADRLALYVDMVYNNPSAYDGPTLLIASIMFAFQIYCDFSGYSDIAIGVAKIMGFDLMTNFRQPYFAGSIREFWQRWHISLSTWFRDYVYIPLGGNRSGAARSYSNLFITFLVSGLWHGANWTFVVWGGLHGLYFISSNLTAGLRKRFTAASGIDRIPGLLTLWRVLLTNALVLFGWIFFRSNSLDDAFMIIGRIGEWMWDRSASFAFTAPDTVPRDLTFVTFMLVVLSIYDFALWKRWRILDRPVVVATTLSFHFWVTVIFGVFLNQQFIYFQF